MWDEGSVLGDPVPALFLLLPIVRHGTSAAHSPLTHHQIKIMLTHRSSVVVIFKSTNLVLPMLGIDFLDGRCR
jgi:hypothetical protein